ncbi:Hypothetical protein ETEE_3892 [Edwardsiella anguillarum ET080813]|uniref:Uncharacterized protein n=1 Tax=Edwardsiella anguillarum ET080813 TaxID=667120 RepID=A0A076LUD3_9GAMM|nr:Hypothetical protein ETEE_3892 [Edwardsiella anguillarum ET080813]
MIYIDATYIYIYLSCWLQHRKNNFVRATDLLMSSNNKAIFSL